MRNVAPSGPIYQAGTLSGNPLSMAAGLITLRRLRDTSVYRQLDRATKKLCDGLADAARSANVNNTINRAGSMWTGFFTAGEVIDWASADKCDRQLYGRFFHAMLGEGVYLAPSQFEAAFVSLAHADEVIERTVQAAGKAFETI
jgi:glutamate-1-semialdehyde 2,1-aminomutase